MVGQVVCGAAAHLCWSRVQVAVGSEERVAAAVSSRTLFADTDEAVV